MSQEKAYHTLCQRFSRIATLSEIESVLFWDNAVVMPPKGTEARSRQIALLPVLQHDIFTLPDMEELFDKATKASLVCDNPHHAANLDLMKREWTLETLIPTDLVSSISSLSVKTERAWRDLPRDTIPSQDIKAFLSLFSSLFDAIFARASLIAHALHITPYDAMLDAFEPDSRLSSIKDLFKNLENQLTPLTHSILSQNLPSPPTFSLDPSSQKDICSQIAKSIGFSNHAGRLDESAHPFSSGNRGDQRITIRTSPDHPLEAFMATLHECGHALYEKGLPLDFNLMPIGKARGMALHESQSLLVENHIGRSSEYLHYIQTLIGKNTPLLPLSRHVKADTIRVTSDEVTYPSHILLRFSIEEQLFSKSISPHDIEDVFNEELKTRLDLPTPSSPKKGWLQDVHWFDGLFGYFPHYLVGAVAAAQFFETLSATLPNLKDNLSKGDTHAIQSWLHTHIHAHGSFLTTPSLIKNTTGKPLSSDAFIRHLRTRYLKS